MYPDNFYFNDSQRRENKKVALKLDGNVRKMRKILRTRFGIDAENLEYADLLLLLAELIKKEVKNCETL